MEHKRLTKWAMPDAALVNGCASLDKDIQKALNRLAELEDKIENGTLIELPCRGGDTFYRITKGMSIQEWKLISISFGEMGATVWAERKGDYVRRWAFCISDFGNTLFTTKEEAEAKLKKLQSKE